jgi:hypothetical protein
MQMRRWLYESKSAAVRAERLRLDAEELARRGFPCFAECAREEAEWLQPKPRTREPS